MAEDYNSQRPVQLSLPEVVVPKDQVLGPGRVPRFQPKTWLVPLWLAVLCVNWTFKAFFCCLPPDKSALKGVFSLEGTQGLRPGAGWKVDSGGDLFPGWYPYNTGNQGTLYLQSATVLEDRE